MTGTTHQMVALVAALWILTLYPVAAGPFLGSLTVLAVMIGALTPDLDHPTANIWRRLLGGNHLGNIFRAFAGGHRHMTHSLVGILVIAWVTRWLADHLINPAYVTQAHFVWTAFLIGYISHPIADTLTDQGVPWLWPLHLQFKFPPGPEEVRVTTDSWVERVVVRSGLVVVAVLLLQSQWSVVLGFFS